MPKTDKIKGVLIQPYLSIWDVQMKIYSLDNIKLPRAISPWSIVYYLMGFFIITIVDHIIKVPNFVRFGLFPMFFVWVVSKQKLDGKKPHKFFIGLIKYFIQPKKYEFFRPIINRSNRLKGFKEKVYFKR